MSVDTPNHRGVDWQDHTIDAGDRQIPIRVFTPLGDDPPDVLVWAHGGSWVSGSVEEWHGPCALMAALAEVTVVAVDYRLAPMHQHPAALLDVLAALDWAQTRFAPLWLAVGGDSAGGTLAAGAAVARREAGTPLAAQVLAYPPLDPTCDSAAYHAQTCEFPSRNRMLAAWRTYTGGGEPDYGTGHPPSTPWHVPDLTCLPPAIIAVGSHDPVRDDVAEYAQRLTHAGVPVTLRKFGGRGHGLFLNTTPEPEGPPQFHRWIAAEVRTLTQRQPPREKSSSHACHRFDQHTGTITAPGRTESPFR